MGVDESDWYNVRDPVVNSPRNYSPSFFMQHPLLEMDILDMSISG